MDTSETYIKMCESAQDIQRQSNFGNGDYIEEARLTVELQTYTYSEDLILR